LRRPSVTISRGPSENTVHRAKDGGGGRRRFLYRGGKPALPQARALFENHAALHPVASGDGADQRRARDLGWPAHKGALLKRFVPQLRDGGLWCNQFAGRPAHECAHLKRFVLRSRDGGLTALLIAVFPANLYMAMHPFEAGAAGIAPVLRWGVFLCRRS
jgi:hypothetical protein